jgi:predicted RecA/RadA family phage recombinase
VTTASGVDGFIVNIPSSDYDVVIQGLSFTVQSAAMSSIAVTQFDSTHECKIQGNEFTSSSSNLGTAGVAVKRDDATPANNGKRAHVTIQHNFFSPAGGGNVAAVVEGGEFGSSDVYVNSNEFEQADLFLLLASPGFDGSNYECGNLTDVTVSNNTFRGDYTFTYNGGADTLSVPSILVGLGGTGSDGSISCDAVLGALAIANNTFTGTYGQSDSCAFWLYGSESGVASFGTDAAWHTHQLRPDNFEHSVYGDVKFSGNKISSSLSLSATEFVKGCYTPTDVFGDEDHDKAAALDNDWGALDVLTNAFGLQTEGIYLSPTFSPENAATGVSLDVHPSITFSEAMDAGTVVFLDDDKLNKESATLYFFNGFGNLTNDADFSYEWNDEKTTLTLIPNSILGGDTDYSLELLVGVENSYGVGLAGDETVTWHTNATKDSDSGAAASKIEIEAVLADAGISEGNASDFATSGIILIPSTPAASVTSGQNGNMSGSTESQDAARSDAETLTQSFNASSMASGYSTGDVIGMTPKDGIVAVEPTSTAANPEVVTLYVEGVLSNGCNGTFPRLYKINTRTKEVLQFTYVRDVTIEAIRNATGSRNAGWTLLNNGPVSPTTYAEGLPAKSGGYTLAMYILDNSDFDEDAIYGQVTDPSTLVAGSSATSSSSSSSSGCVFNPAAGFGLEWLLLLLAPAVAIIRSRFRK